MSRVLVVEYDPTWPARYEAEAALVKRALGGLQVAIEHVGSTSVPGLAAKPTIDLAAGLRTLELDSATMERLDALGYEHRGEMGVPGRRYFRKGTSYPREFNLHVVRWDGALWRDYLSFRDHLRTHPQTAKRYAERKRDLATASADLEAYGQGKRAFIAEVLERAARR
jgi:GrpB-like predicted nucleotidyltransferase (UPF0157 family)